MRGTPPERWIQDVSADDRIGDVVERTLQNRLGAVLFYLPLAAEQAEEDSEHVHQLRVWTRRAGAALILYEELMPRRRLCWIKKQLKRVRRSANDARDLDVLIQRLETKGQPARSEQRWLEEARADRSEVQKAIVAVHDRLRRDHRFARRIDKLLQRVQSRGQEPHGMAASRFGDWAREHLQPVVEQFFAAIPTDRTDEGALHQFRIRGKELRYALELLAGAFPPALRTTLHPAIEALQDRLGVLNDLETSRGRLQEKIKKVHRARSALPWRRLLANEEAQMEQARKNFWEWCTPGFLKGLRDEFQGLLAGETLSGKPGSGPPPLTASSRPSPVALPASAPAAVPADNPAGDGRRNTGSVAKARIVSQLGEQELLLPARVNEALAANDQAKYLMSLLQAARKHADHPDLVFTDLKQERLTCSVADTDLDTAVERSRKENAAEYHIPKARLIHDCLVADLRGMIAPLHAPSVPGPNGRPLADRYQDRLQALLANAPPLAEDRILGAYIDRITSGQRDRGDSLHLLVMDLHKELNRLQQQLATEMIDGACVYGVREADRPLIAAFMAGVNQTRELKFDHPGLGTTATRSGNRLVIQNDIGMTEAHVLVVHVEAERVTLTYTDVHIERLVFFQNLFERFAVTWQDTVSRREVGLREDLYHLCLGTYVARDCTDLLAYLTFLGSRLVFLIDWNRARKRLRKFAPRRVCLEVLRWAADQNVGHMGFLTLGGEHLIFDALQTVGKVPLPPGVQLSDFLGPERTAEFLKFTLQKASEGLRAGLSDSLIRDEISAELRHYIDTAHQGLLAVAAEHASFVVELAMAARDALLPRGHALDRDLLQRVVLRARKWEHGADELVQRSREARGRNDESGPILDLLVTADDSADGLEEAIYWTSLLADAVPAESSARLQALASLLVQGAQEYLKAVENARRLHRSSSREQVADFLEAVDRMVTLEHQTDDAHRLVQGGVLTFAGDFKQWHLVNGVSDRLEESADALKRSVLLLRDYILGEVLRR